MIRNQAFSRLWKGGCRSPSLNGDFKEENKRVNVTGHFSSSFGSFIMGGLSGLLRKTKCACGKGESARLVAN